MQYEPSAKLKGAFIKVSDEEVLAAMRALARGAAIFAEPAGATGYAGLAKVARDGEIDSDEEIVVVVTGNGLKDIPSAVKAAGQAKMINPSLQELERALAS